MKTKKFALNFLCKTESTMEKDDDNIQFDQMPDLDWNWDKVQKPITVEVEKEYNSLYDELLDKCNPSKFNIEAFGLEKFNMANEIFAQLVSFSSKTPEKELITLRNQAIDELGVQISTKKKFNELKSFLNPEQYINRQPYDKELVAKVGGLYNQLIANKNDIRAMEALESFPQVAFFKDEYDYSTLGAMEYLEKHPDGNHKAEAEITLDAIRLQKQSWEEKEEQSFFYNNSFLDYLIKYPNGRFAQRAAQLQEDVEFNSLSADDYVKHYPEGRHIEEAFCYINNSCWKYLKAYPSGRYAEDAKTSRNALVFFLVLLAPIVVVILYAVLN